MAVTYGFYNSLAGDRKYSARDMARIFDGIINDGVYQSVGDTFVVTANPGTMTINVGSGRAWFFSTWTYNDAPIVLNMFASEAVLNRIDTVVIEVNTDTAVRANTIKIVKGTPASSPVAPTLTNTSLVKQYALADIYVGAGVTQILTANITNRVGTGSTPFVTGVLTTLNSTTLIAQWEAEFDIWFNNLVDQLNGTQVTNLQNQIDALANGWIAAGETWTYASADAPTFTFTISGDKTSKYKAGRKIKLTQTTEKYFIITKVVYSAPNTTLTLYGGTDYTLTNAAITNPYFSRQKAPLGFPMEKDKWTVKVTYTSDASQASPVAGNWYNPNTQQIVVPIGHWRLWWEAGVSSVRTTTTATNIGFRAGLATGPSAEPDLELMASYTFPVPGSLTNANGRGTCHREKLINLSAKQTYSLNISTGGASDTLSFSGASLTTTLAAECAYL